MPGQYVVGVDVGAPNTKALLYDLEAGQVVAVASRPTVVHHSQPACRELQPEELWQGVAACLREVMACCPRRDAVAAVAVASMAEAGVPLDATGEPVYPVIA